MTLANYAALPPAPTALLASQNRHLLLNVLMSDTILELKMFSWHCLSFLETTWLAGYNLTYLDNVQNVRSQTNDEHATGLYVLYEIAG